MGKIKAREVKMRIQFLVRSIAFVATVTVLQAAPSALIAQSSNEKAFFCELENDKTMTAYFSGAFHGSLTKDFEYAEAFTNHIRAEHKEVTGVARCAANYGTSDDNSLSIARSKRDGRADFVQHATPPYKAVVEDWTY